VALSRFNGTVREFLSKSIAGGLSAGVVLLWWPVLFEQVDTVTSWFIRGVAWTVCFELLLFALMPVERALWETAHGERITRRVGSAGSRLHSGSPRRRMGRLSAVASVALAVPVVLLVTGLHKQAPAHAEAPAVQPIKVVRVTKIVRPITVTRVVQATPTPAPTPLSSAPAAPRTTPKAAPSPGRTVVGRTAPVQRESAPKPKPEAVPDSAPGCQGDACGSSAPPATGSAS
jgi:hypothetical protein